jgi:hypothetical protein
MTPSSTPNTLGNRIDTLTSDLTGLFEALSSQVASFRAAREAVLPSPAHRFAHKVVRMIKRHPIASLATGLGIAGLAVVTACAQRQR